MVALRDLTADPTEQADAAWLINQHAEYYAQQYGFDLSFKTLVAETIDAFLRQHEPSCEKAWIAHEDGQRLGSIFCVRLSADVAKLRLFYLIPEARGRGIGHLLLNTCIRFARTAGYRHLHLWTHAEHEAACRLYARNGFSLMSSRSVTPFGLPKSQKMIEQMWGFAL